MAEPVAVEVRTESAAECIAAAIAPFGAEVIRARRGWVVEAPLPTRGQLNAALSALNACLVDHAIPSIVVRIDGERYVLNGEPSAR